MNNPAITIVVSLDSPIGLHQGGQVSAPVFQRVATQVLAYLHVQHDVEVKDPKRLLLQAKAKDEDLNDSSPDHPGEPLDFDEEAKADAPAPAVAKAEPAHSSAVKPASQSTVPTARYQHAGGCFGWACESGRCAASERHSDSRCQRWRSGAVVFGEVDAVGD